jgi:DNA-binding transcriptional LysR family regulator
MAPTATQGKVSELATRGTPPTQSALPEHLRLYYPAALPRAGLNRIGAYFPVSSNVPLATEFTNRLLRLSSLNSSIVCIAGHQEMRFNKLDLNLLIALRALLKERSVTRAGMSVHISQSAMSGILGRLRDFFDDPLIVTVGRKMELTPLAQSLVEPINDLLLRIDATITARPEFAPESTRRHFSVVASDYSISVLLAGLMHHLRRQAPGLTVELLPPSEFVAAELESGDIDFVVMPDRYSTPEQSGHPLFEDTYCILVDTNNERIGDSITFEQYVDLGHVAYQAGRSGPPLFDTWFDKEFGTLRRVEASVYSFQLLPQLVIGTDRIATVHTRLAQQFMAQYSVRMIPAPFVIPNIRMVIQWHKYRDLDPGSRWFRDQIIEQARKLGPPESAPLIGSSPGA